MSNLVKLLQPSTYKSKIKLFCHEKEFKIEKFGNLNDNSYICRIIIKEIEKWQEYNVEKVTYFQW